MLLLPIYATNRTIINLCPSFSSSSISYSWLTPRSVGDTIIHSCQLTESSSPINSLASYVPCAVAWQSNFFIDANRPR